jgi:tRNA U34 5-methylaminomethyl-2-thiouridine-forming methyltransferase MnmC
MNKPFQTKLKPTSDGSFTLEVPEIGETYHSVHGACTESQHVFINNGLLPALRGRSDKRLVIMEVGFGTGLNFLLTLKALRSFSDVTVCYEAVEPFPPDYEALRIAGFYRIPFLQPDFSFEEGFISFDQLAEREGLEGFRMDTDYWPYVGRESFCDLMYYDAFAPSRQPEMWTHEALLAAWNCLTPGGLWVTYAAQGAMRRTLRSIGFIVESLPGPPGKREMTRAIKPS